jgi:predicted solute-binding protein
LEIAPPGTPAPLDTYSVTLYTVPMMNAMLEATALNRRSPLSRVLSAETHARALAAGLTRWRDLEAIRSAATDLDAAMADYDVAVLEADQALDPYRGPGVWHVGVPESVHAILAALADQPSHDINGSWTEAYPVRKWERLTREWRAKARKIRRAVVAAGQG